MSVLIGTCIGPYEVVQKLGSGGMGDVYLAEDTRLHRRVALKRLNPRRDGVAADAGAALLHEARAVATLNHPHIAAVYDVLDHDEGAFIVMEYVEGETLATRLARGPLGANEATTLVMQILGALGEAHRHGIIHRDLKPENVILTPQGTAKVLDFGVARAKVGREDAPTVAGPYTAAHLVVGTPGYASPEQLLGRRVDARSDIYSVGVLLFELLSGKRPHEIGDSFDTTVTAASGPPPSLTSTAGVTPAMAAVVERAMALDPANRFASADEMARALETVARGEALPVPVLRGRARVLVSAAIIILLVATGFLLWTRWQTPPTAGPPRRAIVAVLPLQNLSGDATKDFYAVGISETIATNLARAQAIVVVPRTETVEGRRGRSIAQVAHDTGATYVVDGGVQQSGTRLGVNLQLLSEDGRVVWGDRFEASVGELFDLQKRMAEAITAALPLTLTPAERQRLETPKVDATALTEYWQGRALLDRRDIPGNLARAIEVFERIVARAPGFAAAHAALGEAYWQQYDVTRDAAWTTRAIAEAQAAVKLGPDEAQARYSLAVIYRGSGRPDEAVQELERVTQLLPSHSDAPRLLGHILADRGQIDEAVKAFNKAIALRPDYGGNYSDLGIALLNAGRYAEAEAALKRATALSPETPNAFQRLGVLYHTIGRVDEAIKWYEEAIKRGPAAQAYSNLATALYQKQRFAEAADAYERALKLSPSSAITHRNLADTYRRLGRERDARAEYQQAIELTQSMLKVNPKDAANLSRLAVYESKLGRFVEADRHLAEAVGLRPTDGGVLFRKAVVLSMQRKYDASMAALREAVKAGYSRATIRDDDDLAPLRNRADFKALVNP